MAQRPQDALNENLAPKIIAVGLKLILRLLVFVGRPLYFALTTTFSTVVSFLQITGQLLEKLFTQRRLAKKGVIFSAKRHKLKLFILKLKKNSANLSSLLNKTLRANIKKSKEISWKTQVFFLALPKFFGKLKLLLPRLTLPKISFLKILTFFFIFTFSLSFLGGVLFWWYILKDLPPPASLREHVPHVSTKIYDRNGILLYTIFKDQNRTPVALENIPKQVRLATIAIEDAEFYSHPGFSIKGIARAIIRNLRQKKLTGGSTITQQLVKNTLLTPEKTYVRKLKETVLAVQVELSFTKDEVLEMYLNEVAYGGTAYGIQEAARMYFDKDVTKLSLAEAALLAGLPKSPTSYSPFGPNPEAAFARQKEVLRQMETNSFITPEQKKRAEEEEINFSQYRIPIRAPHFVFYVRQTLEEKYGKEVVAAGGLKVTTTLDYQIQKLAEEVVKQEVEKLKNLNVKNGAAVILNPATGEILAMVGSKDYFDETLEGNVNIAVRPRQPGSSIKIINYAYALSNGFTPATIIPDTPVTFLVENQPPYSPRNYEGGYRGSLTLRSAFAESRNIPAVRVLASYGVNKMIEMGQKMGITTWKAPENYGLSLTLGGGETTLSDLARAYATIANYGRRPELVSILKVENYQGKTLEESDCETEESLIAQASATSSALKNPLGQKDTCGGEQVLDPRIAFLITDILRDNSARSPAFGSNSLLGIPGHLEVAVKTGTSNNLRDNLAIGYTQNYVVAAWVGNNDNSEMARIASGVTGATPIFHNIMAALLKDSPNDNWAIPSGLVQLPICPYTSTLACEGCPAKLEWFLEENKPELACNPEWFKKAEGPEPVEGKESEENHQLESQNQDKPDINNQFFRELLEEQERLRKKKPRGRN